MKANRTRKIPLQFYVDENEMAFIKFKMSKAKMKNQSEYLREMAIHGKVVNLNFLALKPIYKELNMIGNNLNQIARIGNKTNTLYKGDLVELQDQFHSILKQIEEIADNVDRRLDSIKKQNFETFEERVERESEVKK